MKSKPKKSLLSRAMQRVRRWLDPKFLVACLSLMVSIAELAVAILLI